MKGRPPKPTEAKIAAGNPGKRPLPAVVSVAGSRDLDLKPPRGMNKYEKEAWQLHVPHLDAIGILDAIDLAALRMLCTQYARMLQARDVLNEYGIAAMGSTNQLIVHPMVAMESAASALYLRFAEHFAATPVARARLGLAQAQAGQAAAAIRDALGPDSIGDVEGEVVDEVFDADVVGLPDLDYAKTIAGSSS